MHSHPGAHNAYLLAHLLAHLLAYLLAYLLTYLLTAIPVLKQDLMLGSYGPDPTKTNTVVFPKREWETVHAHICTCTHVHVHICIYVHTHMHMWHTHMQAPSGMVARGR